MQSVIHLVREVEMEPSSLDDAQEEFCLPVHRGIAQAWKNEQRTYGSHVNWKVWIDYFVRLELEKFEAQSSKDVAF